MATRWSSEFIAAEHRDLQANAMAVDCTGIYVLLAGRRFLAIKNLNDQSDVLRKFPRQSKYEVGAAEWNPSSSHKDVCAISSNQRVEILSWRGGELEQLHLLTSHTRVVSDVNWHRFDPNLLASCSIDTFIHVWDMRDTRRPAQSLSAVAGSTQVRWNRLSCFLLATAHDGDIKLWDQRKGTAPVVYISAHLAKIHGLDWSPIHEDQLATSSQDCTVKFFDITKPRRAESVLPTNSPVWRARYTPFGEGLVTVVVPQLRRGENSLLLWNINNKTAPVHTFVGHTDVVLEFEWRKVNNGSSFSDVSDFELITWSRDQSLRIWRIEPFLQKLCGHEPDMDNIIDSQDLIDDMPQSRNPLLQANLSQNLRDLTLDNTSELSDMLVGGHADSLSVSMDDISEAEDGQNSSSALTASTVPMGSVPVSNGANRADSESSDRPPPVRSPTQPKTLQQEFSLLNVNIPNVKIDSMDSLRRVCNVTATANGHKALLQIQFPLNYPYNSPPTFQFVTGTSLSPAAVSKLLQVLKHTAQQRVQKNRSCLDACLRQLVVSMQQLSLSEEPDSSYLRSPFVSPYIESSNLYRSYTDKHIPFPRTSGARFCGVGLLVCFGRTPSARRLSSHPENCTPRSLSQLSSSWTNSAAQAHSSFFYQDRGQIPRGRQRNIHSTSRSLNPAGRGSFSRSTRAVVVIYDASPLFLLHRELGEKYILFSDDVVGMCQHNAMMAAQVGRQDLVQAWMTASLAATNPSQDPDDDIPWSQHPFGRSLINALVAHYAKESDIQMAAMLCCAFGVKTENQDTGRLRTIPGKSSNISPGGSPYHTIHPIDTTLEGWNYPLLKQNRSNSWSDSLEGLRFNTTGIEYPGFQGAPVTPLIASGDRNSRMLDDDLAPLYDEYKRAYAEILHRWNLLDARAQVLKYMSTGPEPHKGVEFVADCSKCSKPVHGPACTYCNNLSLQCVICHVSVRGSSNFCVVCGHGGHTTHMWLWFQKETQCPTGCGCLCLSETSSVMDP